MSRSNWLIVWVCCCLATGASAQDYGARLGVQRGGELTNEPQGPGVLFGALDPAVRKWYVPQELYNEYHWNQWEYSNYARTNYRRYVSTTLEGDYYYDLYGDFVGRGWLIFNTSQSQPKQFGSSIFKSSRFQDWFTGLLISSDTKGQYHYAVTVSSEIRTILTPMTFSKPSWDGVQIDFASDKYHATTIFSRLSRPGGTSTRDQENLVTNLTTLTGGRFTAQVGDFVTLGLTAVNAHQSNTLVDGFRGNPVTGELTLDQKATVSAIEIILRDDSPEDGIGGAAFFPAGSDIIITYVDGTVDRGKEIRFEPVIEGGFIREGFIAADGNEQIRLRYDFDSPAFLNRSSGSKEEIKKVDFQVVLANDYQLWVTSDQQLSTSNTSVLLLVAQAEGNIQDNTNLRTVAFEYGLPTATQLWGGTMEVKNVLGFDFYGEYDMSYSYTKYPNINTKNHPTSSGIVGERWAPAWMANLSKISYPWFLYGESYSMHPRYNTSTFTADAAGFIDYEDERIYVAELVDDNDDQDRFADAIRADTRTGDNAVFPGWDENNDFISDFNQNDNRVIPNSTPDYEEAFLRHNVDRPEFLFGIDMNNNLWVDRFENDTAPDYPYRKDHRGFNVYGGGHLTPEIRLMAGMLREELISANRKNHSRYLLLTLDRDTARWGRFHLYESLKSVKDNIPDDLLQWQPGTLLRTGEGVLIEDPLVAPDTWVHSLGASHDFLKGGLKTKNFFKYDLYRQRLDRDERTLLSLHKQDYFFGLINKASYLFKLGILRIEPRWKSEYRRQTLDLFSREKREELAQIGGLIVRAPVLEHTVFQSGIELTFFNDLERDSNDFNGIAWAAQFTNNSAYQGYALTMQGGVKIDRRDFKAQESEMVTQSFLTIYAGL
ncbi:MAG: hypothetical protein EXS58_02910 [Candidatus Latescibacteria bacterium]|nr:hypothetical protein [Candidatus Latescibacterota bacterium]